MANPQHVQWLEEGVDAWNKRREKQRFKPDFSRYLFGAHKLIEINRGRNRSEWERVPLRGVNFSDANLGHADLRLVDLSEANLVRADLTAASLSQSILVGTDLAFANLTRANFINADLTGAKFGGYGSRLTDANLQGDVTNADFLEVDLTDVGCLPGKLWDAKLFWPGYSPWPYQDELAPVETVGCFLEAIKTLKTFYSSLIQRHGRFAVQRGLFEVSFYFRGESKCTWELRPSVMRDRLKSHESAMLRDVTARRPVDFSGLKSTLDRWVVAQHYGLKTRFLDVTRNPLVALFHACDAHNSLTEDGRLHVFSIPKSLIKTYESDTICILANFARLSHGDQRKILDRPRYKDSEVTRRLYQLIRSEKPYFDERIDPRDFYRVFVVEPLRSTERIRAQSGAFLVSAFHERLERDEILKWNKDIPIYAHTTLTIPNDSKSNVLDELRLLNISRETLFPGLDASATAVTEHYLQESLDSHS